MSVGLLTLVFAVLFSLGFSIYWHLKEKKGTVNSEKYRIWLTTILRYWIAFHITIFGFEKILGVNFASSYHIDDALLGTLNGQELTWKYYGYSFGLTLIISSFQIIGSFLLLFRRTVLLGVAVLLPVMLNIVLINLFYGIGPITALTSIIMTLGLVYLLLERKKDIINLFTQYNTTISSIGNNPLRIIARVFCVIIPLLFIIYYKSTVNSSDKYFGKWKVVNMIRNGKYIPQNTWEKDTLAWQTIYFEERGKLYYCTNPNMYVDSTSIFMKYDYNVKGNSLKVISYEKNPSNPDTIPVKINNYKDKSMQWNMILYKDTIQMQLVKVTK